MLQRHISAAGGSDTVSTSYISQRVVGAASSVVVAAFIVVVLLLTAIVVAAAGAVVVLITVPAVFTNYHTIFLFSYDIFNLYFYETE